MKKIEQLLKKYPNDFFKKLDVSEKKKYTVAFYLVEKFEDDNIALAIKDNTNEYKLFVSNYEEFERAVHHELYHIIEYYMLEKNKNIPLYDKWNDLNPYGFEYAYNVDKISGSHVYNTTFKNKGAFFISIYSKYSSKEDRAEIFADMMTEHSVKPVYFNVGEPIRKKAQVISTTINNVIFNENKNNLYWNRYLK